MEHTPHTYKLDINVIGTHKKKKKKIRDFGWIAVIYVLKTVHVNYAATIRFGHCSHDTDLS